MASEEFIDTIKKDKNFFNFVFNFDDENKANMLNMLQYSFIAIIPVILILKLIKEYIPEDDINKNSIEISIEIVIQLGILFMSIWFIDKIIRFIPTFSKTEYHKFNETNFVIPLLLILITMQTKLGAKINILYERFIMLINGNKLGFSNNIKSSNSNIRVSQPIVQQTHYPSRGDTFDNSPIQPPPQTMDMAVDKSTTLINALPNYNETNNSQQDPMNLAFSESNEPMAANSLLGGGSTLW